MKICPCCNENWELVGREYHRDDGKNDYFCVSCKSKRKWIKQYETTKGLKGRCEVSVKEKFKKQYLFSNKQKNKIIKPKNILCVGDLHEPFSLKGYRDFCKSVYDRYNCDHVIFMGDIIDNHYTSFHATDPDGLSAEDELEYTINKLKKWDELFPYSDVCTGNHDLIVLRQSYKNGISKRWIKDFHEVLEVTWNFQPSFEYNGCIFRHGVNMKAAPKSGNEMMNTIQGHFHTESYIKYLVGRGKKVFGVQVPCGIDRETYAMAYAKEMPKPAIGCAVILDYGRLPIIEMMDL